MCRLLRSTIRAMGSIGEVIFSARRALRSKDRARRVIIRVPRSTGQAHFPKRRALRLTLDDPVSTFRVRC